MKLYEGFMKVVLLTLFSSLNSCILLVSLGLVIPPLFEKIPDLLPSATGLVILIFILAGFLQTERKVSQKEMEFFTVANMALFTLSASFFFT